MTCILFVVGPGTIYSRSVLISSSSAHMVALCWGKIYFLPPRARAAMFFSDFVLFQRWLSDKWKRLTHPDFTGERASGPPMYGEIGCTVYDLVLLFRFPPDDDGDLFVNKRASKCVRTASSRGLLCFAILRLLCFKRKSSEKSSTRFI